MSKTTQRAVYFREFVPVGTVVPIVDDAPIPEPIPGFLLVRNLAASINPVDKYISAGYFAERGELFAANRAVGSDFAGVVVGVGEGAEVTELDGSKRPAIVGDVVFGDGIAGSGTVSEYVPPLLLLWDARNVNSRRCFEYLRVSSSRCVFVVRCVDTPTCLQLRP